MSPLVMDCFFYVFLAARPEQAIARVCKEQESLQLIVPNEESEEARKLKRIWESILQRDVLTMPTGGTRIIDGEEVVWHGTQSVTKTDKDYVWAIYSTLESEFGYTLRAEQFRD